MFDGPVSIHMKDSRFPSWQLASGFNLTTGMHGYCNLSYCVLRALHVMKLMLVEYFVPFQNIGNAPAFEGGPFKVPDRQGSRVQLRPNRRCDIGRLPFAGMHCQCGCCLHKVVPRPRQHN
jgi:hypothetical protein